jgi:hypothetical protein
MKLLPILCALGLATAVEAAQATVKNESLPVYSKMESTSSVVKTLQRGAVVIIEMSIMGDGGQWCSIHEADQKAGLGYVRCEMLEREPAPAPVNPAPAGAAAAPASRTLDPYETHSPGELRYLGFAWIMATSLDFTLEQRRQAIEIARQTGIVGCIEITDAYARRGVNPPDLLSSGPISACSWTAQTFWQQVLDLATPAQRTQRQRKFEEYSRGLAGQRSVLQRRSSRGR